MENKKYPRIVETHAGKNHYREWNLFDADGTCAERMEPGIINGTSTTPSPAQPQREYERIRILRGSSQKGSGAFTRFLDDPVS